MPNSASKQRRVRWVSSLQAPRRRVRASLHLAVPDSTAGNNSLPERFDPQPSRFHLCLPLASDPAAAHPDDAMQAQSPANSGYSHGANRCSTGDTEGFWRSTSGRHCHGLLTYQTGCCALTFRQAPGMIEFKNRESSPSNRPLPTGAGIRAQSMPGNQPRRLQQYV